MIQIIERFMIHFTASTFLIVAIFFALRDGWQFKSCDVRLADKTGKVIGDYKHLNQMQRIENTKK